MEQREGRGGVVLEEVDVGAVDGGVPLVVVGASGVVGEPGSEVALGAEGSARRR